MSRKRRDREYETYRYEDDEDYEDDYEAYTDEEYEDEYDEDEYEEEERPRRQPKKRKKTRRRRRHGFRNFVVFLLLLAAAFMILGQIPGDPTAIRAAERCNILLAGTDADGYRTDTIMLLSVDRTEHTLRLLSIPRDTYVAEYCTVPKINSAMGVGGGGESGMQELMRQVTNTVGFAPDAYVLIRLDAFVHAVDALGGVDFNVPMDMYYEDWDQDLVIDLRAGEQHLNGQQAMGLVRFRSGYATADIGRTEVQRDFIKAAIRQWLNVKSLLAVPTLWRIYKEEVLTDLTPRNLLWLARTLLKTDVSAMETDILPGYATMVGDASVWMTDVGAASELLNKMDPFN